MSNNRKDMFLDSLLELKQKTHNIRGICYYDVLLNLYFDLGGRLPLETRERLQPTYFNINEIEEILYILVSIRVQHLTIEEHFNEYLLINMMANRVSQVLDSGYKQLFIIEDREGAKGYRASKGASIKDFRDGYDVVNWWESIKKRLLKNHIHVISMGYDKLYYSLRAEVDYQYLKV